jgi:thiamine-phosphate pyrophosphorylase
MSFALPILYPITDRDLAGGLGHARIVELLCAGGATLVQMREKRLPDRELLAEARAAARIAREAGARLVVNDRADVAALCGADGVHVGTEDLPPREARLILGPGMIVGCSTHGVEEAVAAAKLPVDYVAIGPVFATAHSSTPREPLGLETVERAARAISLPLVAIGGIDLRNAGEVLSAGARAVAVIGDLMTARDIPARVAAYLALRS